MKKLPLSKKIARTIEYYNKDTTRRCINEHGGCRYNGASAGKMNTKGCAVGMNLPLATRKYLDENRNKHSSDITHIVLNRSMYKVNIPNFIVDHVDLWQSVQCLHDDNTSWSKEGLSDKGRKDVERIIREHNLEPSYFSELLQDKDE